MTPKLGAILAALVLTGCGGMSNADIIRETRLCEAAGMQANQIYNGLTYDVTAIHCAAKDPVSAVSTGENSPAVTGNGNTVTIDGATH